MTLTLSYVALALREPEPAERLFGEDLGLPRGELVAGADNFPAFRAGAVGLVLVPSGHPFLSGSLAVGLDHLGVTALPAGFAEAPDRTAGVRLRAACGPDLPGGASPWVERIDHIGIASAK